MNLYLVRHAIAVPHDAPGYEEDSQRPLTDRGRAKMRDIARGLKVLGVCPNLILTSPYVRARQTAEILKDVLNITQPLVFTENLLPLAHPDHLWEELQAYAEVDSVALVGHEPNISALANLLLGVTGLQIVFKKGGVCYLTVDTFDREPHATLHWLLTPKQMVAIGKKG
ncbi:MAG: phosphohistidine phosphatase SixA [Armatimonadota bacterium]|nr:phosphohistidine phosphatase SixA [bacterium]MDW8322089.1 phosphohistidine phosphatase SixA [Armatimonadota bacterium]